MYEKFKDTKEIKAIMSRFKLVFSWLNEDVMTVDRACNETYGYVLGVSAMVGNDELFNLISDLWTFFHMAIHPAYYYSEKDFYNRIQSL